MGGKHDPLRKKSAYQLQYEMGVYPVCYRPAGQFYDYCLNYDKKAEKCQTCFKVWSFTDYIKKEGKDG